MAQPSFPSQVHQDWLGASPVFYNTRTGSISEKFNDVVDYEHLAFDPEGLRNYLAFGYSVFGRTPVRDVRFLRQNESLCIDEGGQVSITKRTDPCLSRLGSVCPESQAWEIFGHSLEKISLDLSGRTVCIPTSGGFDSRLINFFYPNKANVRAFSYGISSRQADSFEAVNAELVCQRMGIHWERIDLGGFNRYLPDILAHFGASTHAHGMYHWEFYSKIRELNGGMPMISGIVGDAWAGSPCTVVPKAPADLLALGYSHGLHADPEQCLLYAGAEALEQEYMEQRELLRDERYRVLYLVRTKMMLLSYLLRVPALLGFRPLSPFVDFEVAMSMLTIEPSRWRGRIWQLEFIDRHGLDVESVSQKKTYRNDLDFNSMITSPLMRLDTNLLSGLFKRDYLNWINVNIVAARPSMHFLHRLLGTRGVGRLLRRAGFSDTALQAYSAYLVLSPLQDLLVKASSSRRTSTL